MDHDYRPAKSTHSAQEAAIPASTALKKEKAIMVEGGRPRASPRTWATESGCEEAMG